VNDSLKEKFVLVGRLLLIAWVGQLALFTVGGNFQIKNLWITIITLGPVAVSCLLAIVLSEIETRRKQNVQENEEKN